MSKNKKLVVLLGVIMAISLVGFLGYKYYAYSFKVKNIENLVKWWEEGTYTAEDTLITLEENFLNDDSVKAEYNKAVNEIDSNYESRRLYKEVESSIGDREIKSLTKSEKELYADKLSRVSDDSKFYKYAQEILDKIKDSNVLIKIVSYTGHSRKGNQSLSITVRNVSDKDISYLALDIFEKDSNGNILNSDYTNTTSVIKPDAEVVINTYFDYQQSKSDIKLELRDITFK